MKQAPITRKSEDQRLLCLVYVWVIFLVQLPIIRIFRKKNSLNNKLSPQKVISHASFVWLIENMEIFFNAL